MKNKLLMIIIILIQTSVYSQNYKPFDFENGTWVCNRDYSGGDIERTKEQYYTVGDTVINGIEYFKLFKYSKELVYGPEPDKVLFSGYFGAIRNTDNKQVEIIYEDSQTPEIIYDFNLSAGDTIKNGYGSSRSKPLIVRMIDSVEYCSVYHKRFILNDSSILYQKLIEGIGFNSGLINPFFFQHEQESSLECYFDQSNESCTPCDLVLSKIDNEISSLIEVFPMPNNGYFQIESKKDIIEYSVINVEGQVLYHYQDIEKRSVAVKLNLKDGIYLLRIITSDNTKYLKRIIIKK